jgi:CRISPR-associated protein Cmr4
MNTRLLFIQALSPIHAGTGQGVGVIDQPIAREKATDIPFVPGSTLKGVFRDACPEADRNSIFGPGTGEAELYAGAATFTDARLLLLPVRSLKGVFAWVTSPLLLKRLIRDAGNLKKPASFDINEEDCLISNKSALKLNDGKVILEDLDLTGKPSKEVDDWAEWLAVSLYGKGSNWNNVMKERLCIISDDNLSFLLETATEITARIRLEENKKTVAQGALWYEEALPVETVLVSMVVAAKNQDKVFETIKEVTETTMQFGGNATVGRGLCKASLI